MKPRLNLLTAFREPRGALQVSVELLAPESRETIASAHYMDGLCERVQFVPTVPQYQRSRFLATAQECAQPHSEKSLEWAYPMSETASQYGYPAGCWVVQLGLPGEPLHAVRTFPKVQFDYALEIARMLPFGWSPFCLHVHPEYAASEVLA